MKIVPSEPKDAPARPSASESPAGEMVHSVAAAITIVGKDVARLADAVEVMVTLYRSEIERTRR